MKTTVKEPSIALAIIITALMFVIGVVFNPTTSNIIILIICVVAGLVLPFKNTYLTWWFYTLGGRTPIPEAHMWLADSLKIKTKSINAMGMTTLSILGVSLGHVIYYGYFKYHKTQVLPFFQILAPIITFSLALTLGTALKRKQFLASHS